VVLYVDLSQSMRGFLDPAFPTGKATEYGNVIDVLDARLSPTPIRGFGSSVRVIGQTARGTLVDRSIYSDGNTQMEDVFPLVRADEKLASTHIILGDGRRSSPVSAIDQYVQMRKAAAEWIAHGGTFAVAASLAPFRPVSADPSGCRTAVARAGSPSDTSSDADRARCPLYAFAFIAPREETRVVAALAEVFEHVYVTPLPAVPDSLVQLQADPSQAASPIGLNSSWVQAGSVKVARVQSDSLTTVPLQAAIDVGDTASPSGRAAAAALRGQALTAKLYVRSNSLPAEPWRSVPFDGLVLAGPDALHPRFVSYGPDQPPSMYRIDLVPAGHPTWLRDFDAQDAGDAKRTYGLGRLFQAFEQPQGHPALRAYAVVN